MTQHHMNHQGNRMGVGGGGGGGGTAVHPSFLNPHHPNHHFNGQQAAAALNDYTAAYAAAIAAAAATGYPSFVNGPAQAPSASSTQTQQGSSASNQQAPSDPLSMFSAFNVSLTI